jgi:hypothetical protein
MANIGKEAFSVFKYWDVLQMGVNLFLTKPNTVTAKKNLFLLFINSKYFLVSLTLCYDRPPS